MEPEMNFNDDSPWHHLIFVEELAADDLRDEAKCKLCWEQAVGPVYKCLECDFIQHKSCPNPAEEYWERQMKSHYSQQRHHLMLVEEVENRAEEEVVCRGCQEPPPLPEYRCSIPGCSFLLDKSCTELSLAILHRQHSDHVLTLQAVELWMGRHGKDKRCNGCNELIECLYYGCKRRRCNVYLHPKCSAPETELELEPQPEPRDSSLWHHVIFVEELAYKGKCFVCRKQAVGPVYKCLECYFIQHKSCPKPTTRNWEKWMENHYCEKRHHLMLVEEVENRAEEEVDCWGCQEIAFLPAFKCALPGCSFLLHKSCTELSLAVLHPLHLDHVLTLQKERPLPFPFQAEDKKCNACIKTKKSSLFYGCVHCDFYLHIKCLSHCRFSADDFHEHTVIVAPRVDRFTCQACGKECKDFAYMCSVCRLIMERDCADFPHSIQTTLHGPSLIFIHSVRLINKEHRVLCRFCRKQVNTRYGAYYCIRKCGYILHLNCARRYEDKDSTTESVSYDCEEYTIYLLDWLKAADDERVDEKFKHFDHPQHELTLSHEEPGYDKKCKACTHFLFFAPYYGCVECNFFLHERCAKLPTNIRRGLLHEHPLTHTSSPGRCLMCFGARGGYGYRCDKCKKFDVDVQCGLLPDSLEHVLHDHILFLVRESERPYERCNVCDLPGVCYVCTDCEFRLCGRCVAFPPTVRYRYHPHHLTVTSTNEDKEEENYCLICEENFYKKKIFYWCEKCDFTVHSNCILGDP